MPRIIERKVNGMLTGIIQAFLNVFFVFLRVNDNRAFPPPLSVEDELDYFRKMHEGDMAARDKLIEHNLRLVAHIVKKYYTDCEDQEDLISIGTIGLIKAIDSFKPENGARFATYGARCLQNEILMYFRSKKKTASEVSINETIDIDKDGNPLTYMDIISVEDTIAEDIYIKNAASKAVGYIKEKLEPRERQIMIMRFGLEDSSPMTQKEIAKKLGISRSYVSRIEKAATLKLMEYLK